MPVLSAGLRKQLENGVVAARRVAELGARGVVEGLGVFSDRKPDHVVGDAAVLRNGLRAKWRQVGRDVDLLIGECAFEQWHRLLFARFLAENGLLLQPDLEVAVTLEECEELAGGLGEPDGWSVAGRFASQILPGIFRLDDPCVKIRLAPEHRVALEEILAGLPAEVFTADDSLGWVYQYWQKDSKDEVNASERKVGGADIGPVTQLFTENYMVRFLLENSLGAWWAGRHPQSPLLKSWEYLRFNDDGSPAAGTFDSWPIRVAEVTVMDPCCGSGHFLVDAFGMLWRMRAEEEGLSPVEAQDAVLRDNLFGLELDPRCVQIGMFAVALRAWKDGDGWRALPVPNIACSGIPVRTPIEEWAALAGGDERLEGALRKLHVLFRDADTLGSLIDPRRAIEGGTQRSTDDVDWDEVLPLLERALSKETTDPSMAVLSADASSITRAAELLSNRYSLVVTNVPYLARRNQEERLAKFVGRRYKNAAANLATACISRMREMAAVGGDIGVVSPQNWLFQPSYQAFRRDLLSTACFRLLARLGVGAFGSISGEVVNIHLSVVGIESPGENEVIHISDVQSAVGPEAKARLLRVSRLATTHQLSVLAQPSARFADHDRMIAVVADFAAARQGDATGDDPRFKRECWEVPALERPWERLQTSPTGQATFSGCSGVVDYGAFTDGRAAGSVLRAADVHGIPGIALRQTRPHYAGLHTGARFDMSAPVLFPSSEEIRAALWCFVNSLEFPRLVAELDPDRKVSNSTFGDVPFDVDRWRGVALERFPDGLPEPWSDDPTQWLFEGRPEVSASPLQVAVGRLLGFRWPEQPEQDDLDRFADSDGIVCLPSVAGEAPAGEQLTDLLAAAFGASWNAGKLSQLLADVGSKKKSLADWLRDEFFKQHCALFGNRPFVWHVWDGHPQGFSALVNYHRLDRKALEKLTYTYLGTDWIERQRAGVRDQEVGAEARLVAAEALKKKLELILNGEPPYDIYVRWKPLEEQPIGWEPDLNDGVRLNIRPFVEAGVLRSAFNVHWKKDRGTNPDGTDRLNDIHLTLADKQHAREKH